MEIFEQQILPLGAGRSTCSQEDSPVSRSAWPGSEKERMTTATSGRKCFEVYPRSGPLGFVVKTLVESSVWYNPATKLRWKLKPLYSERIIRKRWKGRDSSSRQFVETLSESDMPSNRYLFQLAVSERRTSGIECGLLLKTPSVFDANVASPKKNPVPGDSGSLAQEIMCGYAEKRGLLPTVQTQGLKECKKGKTAFYPLKLLPTVASSDGSRGPAKLTNGKSVRKTGEAFNPQLTDLAAAGLLPTPKASDYQSPGKHGTGGPDLRTVIAGGGLADGETSRLNPLFAEEMMGFPTYWILKPFLRESPNEIGSAKRPQPAGEPNRSSVTETQ